MEFISIGGLLPGLLPEDIKSGISQLRNRKLADVFHRLNLIESYGTGIRRIFALYGNSPEKPSIAVSPNSFKLILPNMNTGQASGSDTANVTKQMCHALDCIASNENITDAELQQVLQIKKTRLYKLISQMEQAGLLKVIGRGKNKKYATIK
jgi:ATP-dependent DNA helicase RecG